MFYKGFKVSGFKIGVRSEHGRLGLLAGGLQARVSLG